MHGEGDPIFILEVTLDGKRMGKMDEMVHGFNKGIKLGIYDDEVLFTTSRNANGFKLGVRK